MQTQETSHLLSPSVTLMCPPGQFNLLHSHCRFNWEWGKQRFQASHVRVGTQLISDSDPILAAEDLQNILSSSGRTGSCAALQHSVSCAFTLDLSEYTSNLMIFSGGSHILALIPWTYSNMKLKHITHPAHWESKISWFQSRSSCTASQICLKIY